MTRGWNSNTFPTHSFSNLFRPSEATVCLPFWLTLKSHQKVLRMDLFCKFYQASVHQAKPFEDSRRLCSVHEPHGCKHPLFCQIFGPSIVVPPAHRIQSNTSQYNTCTTLKEKIHLHNTVFPHHGICGITNVAIARRCEAKRQQIAPRPQ